MSSVGQGNSNYSHRCHNPNSFLYLIKQFINGSILLEQNNLFILMHFLVWEDLREGPFVILSSYEERMGDKNGEIKLSLHCFIGNFQWACAVKTMPFDVRDKSAARVD